MLVLMLDQLSICNVYRYTSDECSYLGGGNIQMELTPFLTSWSASMTI